MLHQNDLLQVERLICDNFHVNNILFMINVNVKVSEVTLEDFVGRLNGL